MLLGEGSERHVDALGPLDVFDDQATGNLRDHDRDRRYFNARHLEADDRAASHGDAPADWG